MVATARIEVYVPPSESSSLHDGWGPSDPEFLETEAQLLKSEDVAVSVIRDLRLDQNAEFVGKKALEGPNNELVSQVCAGEKAR